MADNRPGPGTAPRAGRLGTPTNQEISMAGEKTRGAPKKQTKKPKAPSTAKAARRQAAKKARETSTQA